MPSTESRAWEIRTHLESRFAMRQDRECPTAREIADAFGAGAVTTSAAIADGLRAGWISEIRLGRGRARRYRAGYHFGSN